jgi:hypothetical protein
MAYGEYCKEMRHMKYLNVDCLGYILHLSDLHALAYIFHRSELECH